MKTILALVLAVAGVGNAAAQTSVSIGINQPGVYGRVKIGDVPRPRSGMRSRCSSRRRASSSAATRVPLRSACAPAELAPLLRPVPRLWPAGLLRSR